MDVSISIVNWNTRDVLADCLESLFNQLGGALTGEVIVVDNCSSDGSVDMVKNRFPDANVIVNTENVGYGRANNQALALSKGKYFILLNSDTVLREKCLESLIDFMEKHPDVGAAGPKLYYGDGSLQLSAAQFPRLATAFWGGVFLNQEINRFFPKLQLKKIKYSLLPEEHDELNEVDWVMGACIITRREAITTVGGMDESIFFYYEETDLCYRLKKAGWKIFLYPQAAVTHFQGISYAGIWDQQSQVSKQLSSLEYFYRKHYGLLSLTAFRLLTAVGSIAKMAVAVILLISSDNERRRLLIRKFLWQWFTLKWYMSRLNPVKREAK